jgi:hypothetical protein
MENVFLLSFPFPLSSIVCYLQISSRSLIASLYVNFESEENSMRLVALCKRSRLDGSQHTWPGLRKEQDNVLIYVLE